MRIEVDDQLVERFRRDGFVVLERVLDADELERWRREVGEAVDERVRLQNGLNNQGKGGDAFYAGVFTQALRLADTHGGARELVLDERLGELAARLVGADAVRLWHDQALVKQPYGNQTSFHRDTPYWSFHTPDAVNFWIALDDATIANGCLWYLPGTHRTDGYELVRIGSDMAGMFERYPEWRTIEAVPAPCPAGSIVIHNAMVVHGAGPNMTPKPRRAMTTAYFPDGCVYNGRPDTLPPAYARTLSEGDRLDDDRYLPLVWAADGRRPTRPMPPVRGALPAGVPAALTVDALAAALRARPAGPSFPLALDLGAEGALLWEGDRVGTPGEGAAPGATVRTDLATLEAIRDGALDYRVAFQAGRLSFEGERARAPDVLAFFG